MTGQLLQEKLAAQLVLNNNAFAVILRDENGLPNAIFRSQPCRQTLSMTLAGICT